MNHRTRQLAALARPRGARCSRSRGRDADRRRQFLLTTSVAPNVVLIIDNSYRMNQIEWHPAFDPDAASTCAAFIRHDRLHGEGTSG